MRSLGAENIFHSGTSLANHLIGTWKILTAWACPDSVCGAGLFHSIYGVLLSANPKSRESLKSALGSETEAILYHLYVVPADSVHKAAAGPMPMIIQGTDGIEYAIRSDLASALVTVDVAGSLEQMLRIDVDAEQFERERALFECSVHLLPAEARADVIQAWRLPSQCHH
jgi:hypothetical protein